LKPYGLISDTHNHAWSAFATKDERGINNRLTHILDEFVRCAHAVHEAGGNTIYHAGDMFHVRGSVAPSVFNPTRDTMLECSKQFGTKWVVVAGNHDQEFKHSNIVGNAVQMLQDGKNIHVVNEWCSDNSGSKRIFLVPWIDSIADFKRTVEGIVKSEGANEADDLIIHAPVDGVIIGLPDHGIDADYLAGLGFGRVFAGHYHSAKRLNDKVVSIGSITHQTWNDVGTDAGFWVISDNATLRVESQAPRFVEIDGTENPNDLSNMIAGNYVRVKLTDPKTAQVRVLREELTKLGAAGVRIDPVKAASTVRSGGAIVKTGSTLEQAITDFVAAAKMPADVAREAQRVLMETA